MISLVDISGENPYQASVCTMETMISKMLQKVHLEQMEVESIYGLMRKFSRIFQNPFSNPRFLQNGLFLKKRANLYENMIFDRKLFSGKQTDLSVGFERAYEQFDMFERSRKVLDEMEKYDFEHERVIIFITDGRVQASEKQVKYEDTMKVSSSGLCRQESFMVNCGRQTCP